MAKILLDYAFPISVVTPTPEASTAFLKQALVIAKPKTGQEGNTGILYECTTMTQVAARTDNLDAQQLFNAGMSKVFVMLSAELDLATAMEQAAGELWTVLISSDYTDADVTVTKAAGNVTITSYANLLTTTPDTVEVAGVVFTAQAGAATLGTATFRAATDNNATAASLAAQVNAHAVASTRVLATPASAVVGIEAKVGGVAGNAFTLAYVDVGGSGIGATVSGPTLTGGDGLDLGAFDGVVGFSTDDADFAADFAAAENRVGFFRDDTNGAKSMFYAFGKLLSNLVTWSNQQYVSMPVNDGVDTLGEANALFDDRVSFVIHDEDFGNRLALFAAGGKAIAAPYIGKNIRLDLQSRFLSWVSANQPNYTLTEAALLEQRLQEDVLNLRYIDTKLIDAGVVEVKLLQSNFVASGFIDISEPKALWRMLGEMTSTL